MGGRYPPSRNFHGGFGPKTGTFNPGGISVIPRNRPGFFPTNPGGVKPSTFDPRTWSGMPNDPWDRQWGKQPWDRGGKFPDPWRPKTKPFGKKFPYSYPSPLDPSRWSKWGWLGLGVAFLPYFFQGEGFKFPAGWIKCWDLGGPKEAFSGPTTAFAGTCDTSSPDYGLGFQVPAGTVGQDTPSVIAWPNDVAMWMGPFEAGGTRMKYMEKWRRPGGGPYTEIPWFPQVSIPFWPLVLPDDPNLWTPLIPVAPVVPTPKPVWDPPEPDVTFPPRVVTGNDYPPTITLPPGVPTMPDLPTVVITSTGPKIGDPHVRKDPKKPESKYQAKGRWAYLATRLLSLASGVYNGITETVDLVSAIYAALPDAVIASHPDNLTDAQKLPFMLDQIYQHRNEIDFAEALTNVANNAIEDAAWGRYFQAANYVRRQGGGNYEGFDRELGELNEVFREVMNAA